VGRVWGIGLSEESLKVTLGDVKDCLEPQKVIKWATLASSIVLERGQQKP
jgi:hypothetical protein